MIDKTLFYIDYLKLLDVIKTYASTSLIDDLVSNLRPASSIDEIEARQDRLEAVLELIKWNGHVPLTEIPDVRDILTQLTIENLVLEVSDFIALHDFLVRCKEIVSFLKGAFEKRPYVDEVLERIDPLAAVNGRIRKTINMEGFLEDSASYDLSKIQVRSLPAEGAGEEASGKNDGVGRRAPRASGHVCGHQEWQVRYTTEA